MIKAIFCFPVALPFFLLASALNFNVLAQSFQPTGLRAHDESKLSLTSNISQYGITWYFDKQYLTGNFANGDFWVVGDTVTIIKIMPDFDGKNNGWQVNPIVNGPQGFAEDLGEFDASLIPKLPYKSLPGQSIVKSIRSDRPKSGANCYECLKTAAVLTILKTIPPDSGQTTFRPAYVGSPKKAYSTKNIKWELLPKIPPVVNAPTLGAILTAFMRVQLDHKEGTVGRNAHPLENIPDYGADIGVRNADGALRLMLNDSNSLKAPALIAYLQYGIDLYQMLLFGQTWPDGGGHRPGQKLPLVFAAIMLNDTAMGNAIKTATCFHEDRGVTMSTKIKKALFGFDQELSGSELEKFYWNVVVSELIDGKPSGFKAYTDPYGYIDGGNKPGGSYQFCCTSQPWKGSALAVYLMPQLKSLWDNEAFFNYVDRWVSLGVVAQPDPCAPADTIKSHYGVTFGPDGHGGCIPDKNTSDGTGRFPELHGTSPDGGGRYSNFVAAMWNAYRKTAPTK
jgi:hypothetical protein